MSNLDREYRFPVWGTQGGGLVRKVGEHYIFVEAPDCPGLGIGDFMPDEWGLAPANQAARVEMDPPTLEEKIIAALSPAEQDAYIAQLEKRLGLEPIERS